eukprot:gb/GEZN01004887.1/.p1 GENE.gb/GEZN01004887.1/~~gb/GEZN01004887.1/.p1  ORF type:complete len:198 (-),score=35.81 gb/GEZN01004887.1/:885-1478(-)
MLEDAREAKQRAQGSKQKALKGRDSDREPKQRAEPKQRIQPMKRAKRAELPEETDKDAKKVERQAQGSEQKARARVRASHAHGSNPKTKTKLTKLNQAERRLKLAQEASLMAWNAREKAEESLYKAEQKLEQAKDNSLKASIDMCVAAQNNILCERKRVSDLGAAFDQAMETSHLAAQHYNECFRQVRLLTWSPLQE